VAGELRTGKRATPATTETQTGDVDGYIWRFDITGLHYGIDELNANNPDLYLYPNPNNGNLLLSFNSNKGKIRSIFIFNNIGQIVYSENISEQNSSYKKEIDLNTLSCGLYLLQLNCEKFQVSKKFILSK
jgi:hypothetical protein